jgi:integrase
VPAFLLTELRIKNAKPGVSKTTGQPIPRMYNDGLGLLLRVGPNGSKSWVYRYRVGDKLHDKGLGSYDPGTIGKGCTLAQARAKAADLRRERQKRKDEGTDPVLPTNKAAPRIDTHTFRRVGDEYVAAQEAGWTEGHRSDVMAALVNHAYPAVINEAGLTLGNMPIADVETAAVLRTIEPKWLTLTETMARTRSRIEAVLGYATAKGYRTGDNPARWANHLATMLPKKSRVSTVERFASLDWEDLPEFMVELRAKEGLVAKAVEFTILTAARTNEVIGKPGVMGATWQEFDLETRVWTIPAGRMKMHRVPLSDAAITLLKASPREGELLFRRQDGGPLVHNSMIRFLDTMHKANRAGKKITVHGFRGTFSTWAAAKKWPYEVRELALAHDVGSSVERRYNTADMLDERRPLMAAWADWCDGKEPAGHLQEPGGFGRFVIR